ncbi:MAG TPA: PKD domain-containing protein [Vicinamibacterales bacterium]|nr:PKD domain-containing protein [Vicinamibacterales bacterium]
MTRRFTRGRWRPAAAALALCLAAAATSCDKMPLAAPTDSVITLFANSTTVGFNGSIEITATVIESAGTPVQNGTVVNFTTTLGTIEPNEARTNNGKATVRFLAGTRSGTAEVRAFSGGISTGDPLSVTVGAAAAGRVELLANPSALPAAGGVVQLTAIVSDASGNRLSGIPVSFTTDAGILAPTTATSDGNGEARAALTTTGKARVTASVVGGTSSSLSATLDIPVRVGPTVTISVPSASLVPGLPATFSISVNAGGAAVRTATIEFGDGSKQPVSTSGLSVATHVYTSRGTYIVTAEATDTAGESATATASVSVQAMVVTVSLAVSSTTLTTSTPTVFTASAATIPAGGLIERYEWDFGDGTIRTTSGPSTSHQYAVGGGRRYVATVRAVTTSGASGTAQVDFAIQ